jgi:hypothetical protein
MSSEKENLILSRLDAIDGHLGIIHKTQLEHHKDIATLKVKAGMWSAIISAFVAIGAWFVR